MKLGLGLGLGSKGNAGDPNVVFDATMLSKLTVSRSSDLLYINSAGKYANESGNVPVLEYEYYSGLVKGVPSFPTVTCKNLYMRPSTGVVGDHFTTGSSSVSIVDDETNPFSDLTDGEKVWEIDNSEGMSDLSVKAAGATDTTSGRFTMQMWMKIVEGGGAVALTLEGTDNVAGNSDDWQHIWADNVQANANTDLLEIIVPAGVRVRITGLNLQNFKFLTNPIDTAGTEVTRTADVISMDGSFYSDAGGTLIYEFWDHSRGEPTGDWTAELTLDNGANSDDALQLLNKNNDTQFNVLTYVGDSSQIGMSEQFTAYKFITKIGIKFTDAGVYELFKDGASVATDTDSDIPSGLNTLWFFTSAEGEWDHGGGWIREVRWYDEVLEDAQINTLTTLDNNEIGIVGAGQSNMDNGFDASNGSGNFIRVMEEGGYLDVKFLNGAKGGSAMHVDAAGVNDYWYDPDTDTKGGAYTDMLSVIDAFFDDRSHVDWITWRQGEQDANFIQNATITKAQFKTALQECFAEFVTDIGSHLKIAVMPLGRKDNAGTDDGYQAVNEALRETIDELDYVYYMGEQYDIDVANNVHHTTEGYNKMFRRDARRILALEGKRSEVGTIGPQVTAAEVDTSDNLDLTITHDAGDDITVPPASTAIFQVEDTIGTITINSITKVDSTTIRLALDRTPIDSYTVYTGYGAMSGLDNVDADVILDNANNPLPLRGGEISGTYATALQNTNVNFQFVRNVPDGVNNISDTREWTTPGGAIENLDISFAVGGLPLMKGQTQAFLNVYNMNTSSIAAGSLIKQITLNVRRLGGKSSDVKDMGIKMIDDMTPVGANKAKAAAWPGSITTETYVWTETELIALGITDVEDLVSTLGFGIGIELNSGTSGNGNVAFVDATIKYYEV